MKKLFTLFFVLLASLASSFASDFVTINGFKFLIDEDKKEATLVPNEYKGDLEIPDSAEYNGVQYPVKAFASNCFGGLVASVKIPSTVTELKSKCFYNSGIRNIEIPTSVTSLGEYCFFLSDNLESISLPNSLTKLPSGCFHYCKSLESIDLPNSIQIIGSSCFWDCYKLKEIIIPEGVSEIESSCFEGCTSLGKITLPSTLKQIGYTCFENDKKLTDIICKASTPPQGVPFGNFSKEACTLYVPTTSLATYQSDKYWSGFGVYKAIEGESDNTQKCEPPTISYDNGEISFHCATEGVEYHYTLYSPDATENGFVQDGYIQLSGAYELSVYSSKADFAPSDKTRATICWLEKNSETDNIIIPTTRTILASITNSTLSIQGLTDGEQLSVYKTDGTLIGKVTSASGIANIEIGSADIVIVKVGGKSIKVAR